MIHFAFSFWLMPELMNLFGLPELAGFQHPPVRNPV